MQITPSDYKFIKKLISEYQRKRMALTDSIRENLKNKKITLTVEDLDRFEKATEEIYLAGCFADRLEFQIHGTEHATINEWHEVTAADLQQV